MYDVNDKNQLPENKSGNSDFSNEDISLASKPTLLPRIAETSNWKSSKTLPEIPESPNADSLIKQRWEGRIAHPRRLVSSMKANLEDLGYQVKTDYNDEPGPVRDTSYFQGTIVANLLHESRSNILFILGILTIIIVVGYWIMKISNRLEQSSIWIEFEGESYYVEARQEYTMNLPNEGRSTYSERTGVVSDISITLQAGIFPGTNTDINNYSAKSLDSELYLFTRQVTEKLANIWSNSAIT